MNIQKVTVIIPARNEEKHIRNIVNFVKRCPLADQIIMVDNASEDNGYEVAKTLDIDVVKCPTPGKGYAMEEGLKHAKNDVVVFIDADVENYYENMIELLSEPILNGECDFVKSTFDRETGGFVTQIAVQPLLHVLFPDLYHFSEPISGMIGCKKHILEELEFEKDYGVDIGILLDIINAGYTFKEINIGRICNNSHLSKTPERMKKMSEEVMSSIVKRAKLKV